MNIHIRIESLFFQIMCRSAQKTRHLQLGRFKSAAGMFSNAQMETGDLNKYCKLNEEASSLLKTAMEKLGLSARAYDRILKVSRTIADLESAENIHSQHLISGIFPGQLLLRVYQMLPNTPISKVISLW